MIALLPYFLFGAFLFAKPSSAGLPLMGKILKPALKIDETPKPVMSDKVVVLNPPKRQEILSISREVDVLARTLWGEDRNGGYRGMQSVANVIINRVNFRGQPFGKGVIGVCLRKGAFSCWNPETGYVDDQNIRRNYDLMKAVTIKDRQFAQAIEIAQKAIAGTLPDVTRGATHYQTLASFKQHQAAGRKTSRSWSYGEKPLAVINSHYFFANSQTLIRGA